MTEPTDHFLYRNFYMKTKRNLTKLKQLNNMSTVNTPQQQLVVLKGSLNKDLKKAVKNRNTKRRLHKKGLKQVHIQIKKMEKSKRLEEKTINNTKKLAFKVAKRVAKIAAKKIAKQLAKAEKAKEKELAKAKKAKAKELAKQAAKAEKAEKAKAKEEEKALKKLSAKHANFAKKTLALLKFAKANNYTVEDVVAELNAQVEQSRSDNNMVTIIDISA